MTEELGILVVGFNETPVESLSEVVKVAPKEVKLVTKPMPQLAKPIGRFTVWSDMDGPGH